MQFSHSKALFTEAQKLMPGGVNSPVRSFKAVGMHPLFIERGRGSKVYDADNNSFIDYLGSWGPLILGHADPGLVEAVQQVLPKGLSFGTCHSSEIALAAEIQKILPTMERLRFVNSGTEAVMSAVRLARSFTGRQKIIKFSGCYHGHADYLLVKAGSGAATLGQPDSAGVPQQFTELTLVAEFNDLNQVQQLVAKHSVAAILVEPIAGNMGFILPEANFLAGLRNIADQHGIVLIFDEVMTGFRVALGGAQSVYSVQPDLTVLGKVIGGGMPVGAFGGRKDIMEHLAPLGKAYQAGTLSGNPIAMAAGLYTLKRLQQTGVYQQLENYCQQLVKELVSLAKSHQLGLHAQCMGSMFGFFLSPDNPKNYAMASQTNTKFYAELFKKMLHQGVYLAPSAFECGFVSLAHNAEDLQKTTHAFATAFEELCK